MKDVEIIAVLKTYVAETLAGAGSLEGAPCTIQSVTDNGDGTQTMVFAWEDNDGTSHTTSVNLPSAIFDITSPTGGQVLAYDATNHVFINISLGTAAAANTTDTPTASSADVLTSGGAYTALATKVDKVAGKALSANDFTDAYKTLLDGAVASISVNGDAQTITDNAVDLDIASSLITPTQWTALEGIFA